MKRKQSGEEKYFIYVQVLNYRKAGMKNAEIARLLNKSTAKVTRIFQDEFFKQLQARDNLQTAEMSHEVSRHIFAVQSEILQLAERLIEKTKEGKDKDSIELLIKSLNCLNKFCQYQISGEVK